MNFRGPKALDDRRARRAWAMITRFLSLLTHGEGIPVSRAIRPRGIPPKNLLHCLRACGQFLFQKYVPRSFQNVVSARSIQAHSQSLPFNFFDRTCGCGGNPLHWSLYRR